MLSSFDPEVVDGLLILSDSAEHNGPNSLYYAMIIARDSRDTPMVIRADGSTWRSCGEIKSRGNVSLRLESEHATRMGTLLPILRTECKSTSCCAGSSRSTVPPRVGWLIVMLYHVGPCLKVLNFADYLLPQTDHIPATHRIN